MIERYADDEFQQIFSDLSVYQKWLEVELAVVKAFADLKEIPQPDLEAILNAIPKIDESFVSEVKEREKVTDHDLAAFVDVIQQKIHNKAARWIHFGLTSSDVVDTALSLIIRDALTKIKAEHSKLIETAKKTAIENAHVKMIGRTHGMHAEPTTFGIKAALWCHQLARDKKRLEEALDTISVGKLAGAVGTYSNIDVEVEKRALSYLSLKKTFGSQVIPRDRHAQVVTTCAFIASSIESIANEIRHLSRTEVSEVKEAFKPGQKGSSAMPHKQNPILSERLCGLARVIRSYLVAAMENITLLHERDISHSSVERMMFPDVLGLTYYMLKKTNDLLTNLQINKDEMLNNLESSKGQFFSQTLLLALIKKGLERDEAYRLVQLASQRSRELNITLRESALKINEIAQAFDDKEFEKIFSLDSLLKNVYYIVDSAREIE